MFVSQSVAYNNNNKQKKGRLSASSFLHHQTGDTAVLRASLETSYSTPYTSGSRNETILQFQMNLNAFPRYTIKYRDQKICSYFFCICERTKRETRKKSWKSIKLLEKQAYAVAKHLPHPETKLKKKTFKISIGADFSSFRWAWVYPSHKKLTRNLFTNDIAEL